MQMFLNQLLTCCLCAPYHLNRMRQPLQNWGQGACIKPLGPLQCQHSPSWLPHIMRLQCMKVRLSSQSLHTVDS